jgi:hypothetical protein
LLPNPHDAVREELGTSSASTVTIRVVEEQPGEVVLALPARPMASGRALPDEELEDVAERESASTCYTLPCCY